MKTDYLIKKLTEITPQTAADIFSLMKQLDETASEISAGYLEKVISSPSTLIFVAVSDQNRIIGTATMVRNLSMNGYYKTWLEDVVVDETHRRKGIAQALVKAALAKARQLKIRGVYLTSRPCRIAANNLYKKLGFKIYETNVYKYEIK